MDHEREMIDPTLVEFERWKQKQWREQAMQVYYKLCQHYPKTHVFYAHRCGCPLWEEVIGGYRCFHCMPPFPFSEHLKQEIDRLLEAFHAGNIALLTNTPPEEKHRTLWIVK